MLKYVGTKRRKAQQEKISIKLRVINLKVLAKDGRLKRYQQRTKLHIPKQQKKILPTSCEG